ncbi:MAG: hypothetical protein J7496_03375 [Novosphingobium sp.]|nr:hypothetical protein [Novosphingobium sp.]MBO9601532.1 hypothetical protein [Novosphingobium sp.]
MTARDFVREVPTPYLAAGAAAVALGVLATPLRRLLFNVPVLTMIGGAILGRKEAKSEAPVRAAPRSKAASRKRAPAKKAVGAA